MLDKIILSIIILFLPLNIFSQDKDRLGRTYWEILDKNQKMSFLVGMYSGFQESILLMEKGASHEKRKDPFWVAPFNLDLAEHEIKEYFPVENRLDSGLIADMIDNFYHNPDNEKIELLDAIHILILHHNGHVVQANELLLIKQKENNRTK